MKLNRQSDILIALKLRVAVPVVLFLLPSCSSPEGFFDVQETLEAAWKFETDVGVASE